MKTPVRYSHGRMWYTGRLEFAPFVAWAESSRGKAAIDESASLIRFSLWGKARAARRRVWRQLVLAARAEAVVVAMQREVDLYLERLDTVAYAHDLPRAGIDLHRLVVVPRLFVNGQAYRAIDAALCREPAFQALAGGEPLRSWFILELVEAVQRAVARARPSPRRPLPAGKDWITVGVNEHFEWRIPFDGPAWPGHYHVLELTRGPITRSVRKAASEAMSRLDASLASLSVVDRNEILRQAGLSLEQLFAGT